MDDILKKMERLSVLAARRPDPRPLDVSFVMAGIRGLEMEDDNVLSLPLGFLTGGAAAAAVAAVVTSLFALTAWTDMSSPYPAMASLLDVMDAVL